MIYICLFPLFFSYTAKDKLSVKTVSDGIELTCKGGTIVRPNQQREQLPVRLPYMDDYSGEYTCISQEETKEKIFVKFRSKFCINTSFSVM